MEEKVDFSVEWNQNEYKFQSNREDLFRDLIPSFADTIGHDKFNTENVTFKVKNGFVSPQSKVQFPWWFKLRM